jgi:hypothetical protein
MPALFPQYLTHMPAIPCHICGTLTTSSRVEPLPDGRYTLVPVCHEHRVQSPQGERP